MSISKKIFILIFVIFIVSCNKYDEKGFDLKTKINKYTKTLYDKGGFDINGFNKDGFNKGGFNRLGYNKDGYNKNGYDDYGFNKDGFNKDGYDRLGFNKDGYDKNGVDQKGYDKDGFNSIGFNRDTNSFYDLQGFTKEGKVNFDFYKNTSSDSLEDVNDFAKNIDLRNIKSQFETDSEYNQRISLYKNELLKVFTYEDEYNSSLSYDINREAWTYYVRKDLFGFKVNIFGDYMIESEIINPYMLNFSMEKEKAKLNQNPKIQILYQIVPNEEGVYSSSKFLKKGTLVYHLYIKVLAVIVWDENKNNVLHYRR